MRLRVCSLYSSIDNGWLFNLRPSEALSGKRRTVGFKGWGV
jgi:hypothetical protein